MKSLREKLTDLTREKFYILVDKTGNILQIEPQMGAPRVECRCGDRNLKSN